MGGFIGLDFRSLEFWGLRGLGFSSGSSGFRCLVQVYVCHFVSV